MSKAATRIQFKLTGEQPGDKNHEDNDVTGELEEELQKRMREQFDQENLLFHNEKRVLQDYPKYRLLLDYVGDTKKKTKTRVLELRNKELRGMQYSRPAIPKKSEATRIMSPKDCQHNINHEEKIVQSKIEAAVLETKSLQNMIAGCFQDKSLVEKKLSKLKKVLASMEKTNNELTRKSGNTTYFDAKGEIHNLKMVIDESEKARNERISALESVDNTEKEGIKKEIKSLASSTLELQNIKASYEESEVKLKQIMAENTRKTNRLNAYRAMVSEMEILRQCTRFVEDGASAGLSREPSTLSAPQLLKAQSFVLRSSLEDLIYKILDKYNAFRAKNIALYAQYKGLSELSETQKKTKEVLETELRDLREMATQSDLFVNLQDSLAKEEIFSMSNGESFSIIEMRMSLDGQKDTTDTLHTKFTLVNQSVVRLLHLLEESQTRQISVMTKIWNNPIAKQFIDPEFEELITNPPNKIKRFHGKLQRAASKITGTRSLEDVGPIDQIVRMKEIKGRLSWLKELLDSDAMIKTLSDVPMTQILRNKLEHDDTDALEHYLNIRFQVCELVKDYITSKIDWSRQLIQSISEKNNLWSNMVKLHTESDISIPKTPLIPKENGRKSIVHHHTEKKPVLRGKKKGPVSIFKITAREAPPIMSPEDELESDFQNKYRNSLKLSISSMVLNNTGFVPPTMETDNSTRYTLNASKNHRYDDENSKGSFELSEIVGYRMRFGDFFKKMSDFNKTLEEKKTSIFNNLKNFEASHIKSPIMMMRRRASEANTKIKKPEKVNESTMAPRIRSPSPSAKISDKMAATHGNSFHKIKPSTPVERARSAFGGSRVQSCIRQRVFSPTNPLTIIPLDSSDCYPKLTEPSLDTTPAGCGNRRQSPMSASTTLFDTRSSFFKRPKTNGIRVEKL